jgi:hypothetical protein
MNEDGVLPMSGIVYVLSNPAMPGLLKIGHTTQEDINIRLGQLYSTGVPVPFQLEFACRVENPEEVEEALHEAFAPNRINPKREFFRLNPSQPLAILRLLDKQSEGRVEDVTEEVARQSSADVDAASLQARDELAQRRPNLNFEEMGIPVGARLYAIKSGEFVTVTGPKKVRFDNEQEDMSLTQATRRILGTEYSVAPIPHWTYEGRSLREIYNETYGD